MWRRGSVGSKATPRHFTTGSGTPRSGARIPRRSLSRSPPGPGWIHGGVGNTPDVAGTARDAAGNTLDATGNALAAAGNTLGGHRERPRRDRARSAAGEARSRRDREGSRRDRERSDRGRERRWTQPGTALDTIGHTPGMARHALGVSGKAIEGAENARDLAGTDAPAERARPAPDQEHHWRCAETRGRRREGSERVYFATAHLSARDGQGGIRTRE